MSNYRSFLNDLEDEEEEEHELDYELEFEDVIDYMDYYG